MYLQPYGLQKRLHCARLVSGDSDRAASIRHRPDDRAQATR
ncbi:hypothetical protein [Spirosoma sp. 209]|nr:hypothetical protein [Spirosoma sp. 209]